jgi:putative transposase
VILDILVKGRCDAGVAKRFFKRLLKGLQYTPRVLVIDKLGSYGVVKRELVPDVEHRQSHYLNYRAENSHRPTWRSERQMQRFLSSQQAQPYLSTHVFIYGHFHPRRHRMAATSYRAFRVTAFKIWQEATCVRMATQSCPVRCFELKRDHDRVS